MSGPQYFGPPPPRRDSTHIWIIAILAIVGSTLMLCCGAPCLLSALVPNKVTTADKRWNAGQKEEAVSLYVKEIESSLPSRAPHIYERTIEHHIERGNLERAEHFCDLALQRKIELSPQSEKARELLAEAKRNAAIKNEKEQAATLAKEEQDKKAREAATAERQEKKRVHLDEFLAAIKSVDVDGSIVESVEVSGEDAERAEITVRDIWHLMGYQLRLQSAQNLWKIWASIASPSDVDHARISIVDANGNEVGGSRFLAGSLVWVQEN